MVAEKVIETAASEQGEKVDVDMSGGKMTVKTEEGTARYDFEKGTGTFTSESGETSFATGESAEIPADFPKDVPVYSNLKLTMVVRDDVEKAITFSGTVSDDAGKVTSFYKDAMMKEGWTEESALTQDMGKMNLLAFTKGERETTLMIISGQEGTELTLTTKQ